MRQFGETKGRAEKWTNEEDEGLVVKIARFPVAVAACPVAHGVERGESAPVE